MEARQLDQLEIRRVGGYCGKYGYSGNSGVLFTSRAQPSAEFKQQRWAQRGR